MVYVLCMRTASDVIDELGRKAIMAAVGVSTQAVTNAKTAGEFHGTWYGPMAALAEKQGKILPRDAFAWRAADLDATA